MSVSISERFGGSEIRLFKISEHLDLSKNSVEMGGLVELELMFLNLPTTSKLNSLRAIF